jgi:hypothetical protein
VIVSADPSASIWEVTRLILDSPGASPSAIAHAHGFSAVEVVELLPIFLENVRSSFSQADGSAAEPAEVDPPAPLPGESAEEHAERYLRELAGNERLDVIGYDSLGEGGAGDDPTFLDAMAGDGVPETDGGTGEPETDGWTGEPIGSDDPYGESVAAGNGRIAEGLADQPGDGLATGGVPEPQESGSLLDLVDDDPFVSIAQPVDADGADPGADTDDPVGPEAIG